MLWYMQVWFNLSPIHIKGVGFAKVWSFMWNWCSWSADWFRQNLGCFMWKRSRKSTSLFYSNLGIFIKLLLIECVSILSKFKEPFIKLTFTKFGCSFAKLSSMDCELISPKLRGVCKIYVPNCFWPLDRPIDGRGDLGWRGHLLVQGNAPELVGKLIGTHV